LKDESKAGRAAKLSKDEFASALGFMQDGDGFGGVNSGSSKVAYDRLIEFMFSAIGELPTMIS
jgi:hypothetical protein